MYVPWYREQPFAVTQSQLAFLTTNARLAEEGTITPEEAQFNEYSFTAFGWKWADKE